MLQVHAHPLVSVLFVEVGMVRQIIQCGTSEEPHPRSPFELRVHPLNSRCSPFVLQLCIYYCPINFIIQTPGRLSYLNV